MSKHEISNEIINDFLHNKYDWDPEDEPIVKEIKWRLSAPFKFYRLCDHTECEFNHKGFCPIIKKRCEFDISEDFSDEYKKYVQSVSGEIDVNGEKLNCLGYLKCMLVHYAERYETACKQRDKLEKYAKECEKEALSIREQFGVKDKEETNEILTKDKIFKQIYDDWLELFGTKTPREVKNDINSFKGQGKYINSLLDEIKSLRQSNELKDKQIVELQNK